MKRNTLKKRGMKQGALVILAAASVVATGLVVSCKTDHGNQLLGETSESYQSYKSSDFAEKDFSPWMSKAEAQIQHEKPKKGDYFAVIEGRDNNGLSEYRFVQKSFPANEYSQWAVYWGLSPDEFYQVDLKMLHNGFTRSHTQVFRDATGKSYHQAVWLKKLAKEQQPATNGSN